MGRPPARTIIQQQPIAEAAPPITPVASDVVQAGMDMRQQELLRKNIKSTIRAGDTGGFNPAKGKARPVGGSPFTTPIGGGSPFIAQQGGS